MEVARQQEQQAMHQQEQRGVNSLQNAVSAATGAGGLRAGISPRVTPMPGQQDPNAPADGQQGPPGMEKRGPVEFNHAISYVNKIKVSENSAWTCHMVTWPYILNDLLSLRPRAVC
jgi:paired amphipathic helix protein Sin3a